MAICASFVHRLNSFSLQQPFGELTIHFPRRQMWCFRLNVSNDTLHNDNMFIRFTSVDHMHALYISHNININTWDTTTFTGIHVFLLVHFYFEMVQFESNWTPFVSNRLKTCIKIDFHLCQNDFVSKQAYTWNPSQTALHIQCDALWDQYDMADGWHERTL